MVAIPSFWDERKLLVFVALIIVAASAMLLQIDAVRHGRQNLIDEAGASVFAPIGDAVLSAGRAIAAEASALAHAGSLAHENEQLRARIVQLQQHDDMLHAAGAENVELKGLIGMRDALPKPSIAADVVGYAPEAGRLEIAIDRGTVDGVGRDAVVVGSTGLVGHVVDAGPHEAHVLLVIDQTSAVPAYLERSRCWGIVVGTSLHVKMKYIAQDKKVAAGDLVVTGRGEVYPGGIPIGRVREVDKSDSALYQTAILDSAIDFSSLTRVLVLPAR
ncbi:MAG TPA: rod shape-determining protein MreC [Candidatus Eremiobacteraceae bacterium]|nr:rod shape-determining protein MreC [Candidatus Eremiobacteraceae bacterium]